VDDLIQDGCVAMLQGRQAWYGAVDGLREWLGRRRTWTLVDLDEALDCSYVSDPMRRLIVQQELARVMERMDRWTPKKRCAWMLRYQEDKTQAQIGAILGVTVGRVSQWFHRDGRAEWR
jgi:RNA polymerase sigma factor (sigma-70 family)